MIFTLATFLAGLFSLASILLAFALIIRAYLTDASSREQLSRLAQRMAVYKATATTSQTLLHVETFDDFMTLYSRPLLSSLVDLQAMLSLQVRKNYLHMPGRQQAAGVRSDNRWHIHMFAFNLAEFFAWMEIFRVQSQTMRVSTRATEMAIMLDDIKQMFEDNRAVQGVPQEGVRQAEVDKYGHLLQLHYGELQAIGSAIGSVYRRDETSHLSFRVPLAIDEFLRAVSVPPPPVDAPYQLQLDWVQSVDSKLQVVLAPLLDEVSQLAELDEQAAPAKRLAIVQVLLCKLIDVLDPGVPWDVGSPWDEGETRPVVARNERITPLVRYLSNTQREWLCLRPYFKYMDPNLSFPGFRADLSSLSQEERDMHPELWSGACPPSEPRRRPPRWRKENVHFSQKALGSGAGFMKQRA